MNLLSCQFGIKNCIKRNFLSPFCIHIIYFFHRTGTFINKPLSRDSREETYEINAVDPVEKDQIEAKL